MHPVDVHEWPERVRPASPQPQHPFACPERHQRSPSSSDALSRRQFAKGVGLVRGFSAGLLGLHDEGRLIRRSMEGLARELKFGRLILDYAPLSPPLGRRLTHPVACAEACHPSKHTDGADVGQRGEVGCAGDDSWRHPSRLSMRTNASNARQRPMNDAGARSKPWCPPRRAGEVIVIGRVNHGRCPRHIYGHEAELGLPDHHRIPHQRGSPGTRFPQVFRKSDAVMAAAWSAPSSASDLGTAYLFLWAVPRTRSTPETQGHPLTPKCVFLHAPPYFPPLSIRQGSAAKRHAGRTPVAS